MPGPAHEHRLRVRYAETDQMGVAHHANYLVYVEEGRTRMMADRGLCYAELERRGYGLPVRRASLRYLLPALYEEELLVRTEVTRVKGASLAFATEIRRASDGALCARCEIELACIRLDERERGPCPLPDDLRRALGG